MLRFGYLVLVGSFVACSLFACGDKLNPKGNAPTAAGGTTGEGGTTGAGGNTDTGGVDGGEIAEAGAGTGGASGTGGTTAAAVVSYKNTIAPIMVKNCVACHAGSSAFAGVELDTYAGVAAEADPSLSTMQTGAMPPGGSVSAADLKSFQDWIKAGKPNN